MRSLRRAGTRLARAGIFTALALTAFAAAAQESGDRTTVIATGAGAEMTVRLAGDWSPGACPPVLILSHGLGGDERALGYAVETAAAAGWRVMVMAHAASGRSALVKLIASRDRPAAILEPAMWQGRAADLAAAHAYATRSCRPRPLVLGGHSMGAAITMMEAGARGRTVFAGEDRFDAYVAISPQGIGWAFAGSSAWAAVSKPVLMITGTRDNGIDGTFETRLVAFDSLPPGRKRLAVVEGATHLDLGGRRGGPEQAAAALAEFLRHLRQGWAPSALGARPGLAITEK